MSNIHSQTLERPVAASPGPITPIRSVIVVAAFVGLVAGLLIGWFVHQPSPIPAYSRSGAVDATVYFDGTHASYAGPAEVKTGTVVTLRLVSNVPEASLALSLLSPAPTWATLTHDIATANTSTSVMPMQYVHNVATATAGAGHSVRVDRAGLYSVWAGPATSGSASVVLATMIRVIG